MADKLADERAVVTLHADECRSCEWHTPFAETDEDRVVNADAQTDTPWRRDTASSGTTRCSAANPACTSSEGDHHERAAEGPDLAREVEHGELAVVLQRLGVASASRCFKVIEAIAPDGLPVLPDLRSPLAILLVPRHADVAAGVVSPLAVVGSLIRRPAGRSRLVRRLSSPSRFLWSTFFWPVMRWCIFWVRCLPSGDRPRFRRA